MLNKPNPSVALSNGRLEQEAIQCLAADDNVIGTTKWYAAAVASIMECLNQPKRQKPNLRRQPVKKSNQYCSSTSSVVVEAISFGAASHILSSKVRSDMVSSTWTRATKSASPETS